VAERLHTPWTHKLIVSPLGMLLDTRLFEWIKDRSLPREFRMARTGAAAAATVGEEDGAFLDALGVAPDALDAVVRDRLPEAIDVCEAAFWGRADVGPDERVAREKARREASERCVTPSDTLGFLAREDAVPPVRGEVPAPEATVEAWADALADPTTLYAAPDTFPPVETSRPVPGPAGPEHLRLCIGDPLGKHLRRHARLLGVGRRGHPGRCAREPRLPLWRWGRPTSGLPRRSPEW